MSMMADKSKKIISLLFTLIIAAGFIFWYIGKSSPRSSQDTKDETSGSLSLIRSKSQALNKLSTTDTDQDGLLDWEEELWNTSKTNPDTDDDGTKDGDEIRESRNPIKAGPDDSLNIYVSNKGEVKLTHDKELTATDEFARNFFSNYTTLTNPGLDDVSKQAILEEIVDTTDSNLNTKVIASVKITSLNSLDSYKKYGNELAEVFSNNSDGIASEELPLFESYMSGNLSALNEIKLSASGYSKIAGLIENISVPSDLKTEHESLIIALKTIKLGLDNLTIINQDPLKAIFGLQQYESGQTSMYNAMINLRSQITLKGIVYEKDEPGYVLIYI